MAAVASQDGCHLHAGPDDHGPALMAAAGASAPLLQGDAAPATARAGCSARTMSAHQRPRRRACSCRCTHRTPWCCDDDSEKTMMLLGLLQKTASCHCVPSAHNYVKNANSRHHSLVTRDV